MGPEMLLVVKLVVIAVLALALVVSATFGAVHLGEVLKFVVEQILRL